MEMMHSVVSLDAGAIGDAAVTEEPEVSVETHMVGYLHVNASGPPQMKRTGTSWMAWKMRLNRAEIGEELPPVVSNLYYHSSMASAPARDPENLGMFRS
jgi:hypothetical protein